MFNLQGSEIIFILLLALVVLGPEKLPGAIRRATKTYVELRKLGDGFQSEFRSVIDEPLRELRDTADLVRGQADPKKLAEQAEREAEAEARLLDRSDAVMDGESTDTDPEQEQEQEPEPVTDAVDDATDPFDDPVDEPTDEPEALVESESDSKEAS